MEHAGTRDVFRNNNRRRTDRARVRSTTTERLGSGLSPLIQELTTFMEMDSLSGQVPHSVGESSSGAVLSSGTTKLVEEVAGEKA